MPSKLVWCLRVLDVADIVALIVLNSVAINVYIHRKDYIVDNRFLVEKGLTSSDCDDEAFEFLSNSTAENAGSIINGFNAAPVIIAVVSMTLDFGISVFKLVGRISQRTDKILTMAEILLTFLFAPIAFPVSDFEY